MIRAYTIVKSINYCTAVYRLLSIRKRKKKGRQWYCCTTPHFHLFVASIYLSFFSSFIRNKQPNLCRTLLHDKPILLNPPSLATPQIYPSTWILALLSVKAAHLKAGRQSSEFRFVRRPIYFSSLHASLSLSAPLWKKNRVKIQLFRFISGIAVSPSGD